MGGWAFGIYFLLLSIFQALALAFQLLNIMSKVEAILELKEGGSALKPLSFLDLFRDNKRLLPNSLSSPVITNRRVDIS